ncbi:hypothetical protein ACFLXJ_06775 [Chloroflexota bacterium]
MLNTNYSTKENQTPIPVQRSMFGPDKYLADTRQKLATLYYQKPEVFEREKQVILEYWQAYEGLGDILKDKLSSFVDWFKSTTSPETITRSLRGLKEDGTIKLNPEKAKQRQEREQEWRQYWGDEKQLREEQ